jgi:hypothetical protein
MVAEKRAVALHAFGTLLEQCGVPSPQRGYDSVTLLPGKHLIVRKGPKPTEGHENSFEIAFRPLQYNRSSPHYYDLGHTLALDSDSCILILPRPDTSPASAI